MRGRFIHAKNKSKFTDHSLVFFCDISFLSDPHLQHTPSAHIHLNLTSHPNMTLVQTL